MSAHDPTAREDRARFHVRVPGFVADEEIGLGDAITRVTSRMGIRRCGGCARRAETLDRMVAVHGRSTRGRWPR